MEDEARELLQQFFGRLREKRQAQKAARQAMQKQED